MRIQPKGEVIFKVLLVGLFTVLAGGIVGGLLACAVGLICSQGGGGGGGTPITLQADQCTSAQNACGQSTIGTLSSSCPAGYTLTPPPDTGLSGGQTCYQTRPGAGDEPAVVYVVDGNGSYITVAATQSCNATKPDNSQCPSPSIPPDGFSANPTTIGLRGQSTLTWSSSNTTSCSITSDSGWSSPAGGSSGSVTTPTLTQTTTFTLTCEDGPGGPSANRSVKVIVDPHFKEI